MGNTFPFQVKWELLFFFFWQGKRIPKFEFKETSVEYCYQKKVTKQVVDKEGLILLNSM